jgi:DNA-directed RNA polymerase alpha subunit
VLTDSRLASTLGNAARKRVHSTFLEEHFATRFRAALRRVLQLESDGVGTRAVQSGQPVALRTPDLASR